MNVSRQIQSRLKADFENAGMAQPDSFFQIDGEVIAFDIQIEKPQVSVGKTKFCANFGF